MLLYVDIIDACHLKCPTCVRGVRAFPNTPTKMSLNMFRKIVTKAKNDGAYRVDIFSWIEPFLCKNLHEYIAIVKDAGLPCGVSTTLSLSRIPNFAEALQQMDLLTISISGFEQSVYEVNHRGGNVEWVKRNLEKLSMLKRSGQTKVDATLRMLRFDYNAEEEIKLRYYAVGLGINFEVLRAAGHPVHMQQSPTERNELLNRLGKAYDHGWPQQPGKVCPLIFEHVTVNAEGDVYQCTAYGNFDVVRIGPYLDLTREEVLFRRYVQPLCKTCTWSRRDATADERVLLHQALGARLAEPVSDRVPRLSGPLQELPRTAEGHIVEKHLAWRSASPSNAGRKDQPERN
jgi:MoaA/NifB/PqqE/SkfB family radical SAM enzyme